MTDELVCYGCLNIPQTTKLGSDILTHPLITTTLKGLGIEGFYFSVVQVGLNDYSINIYGPLKDSRYVSSVLDGASICLRHPHAIREGVRYINFQWFPQAQYTNMNRFVVRDGKEIIYWAADFHPRKLHWWSRLFHVHSWR
ncbi:hypothetical protein V2G26_017308 [Clonostachys chloroleuca]